MDLGWVEKPSLPEPAKDFKTAEVKGNMYVLGGSRLINGVDTPSKAVYVYNSVADAWQQKSDMPYFAKDFALASAYGKLYLIGGQSSDDGVSYTATSSVYEYDTDSDSWREINSLVAPRYNLNAINLNGKIIVAGGQCALNLRVVEILDPLTGTFTRTSDLPVNTLDGEMFLHNGIAMLSYGNNILSFNEKNSKWSKTTPSGTHDCVDYATAYGKLFGFGSSQQNVMDVFEYDPEENEWIKYKTFNHYGVVSRAVPFNSRIHVFIDNGEGYAQDVIEYMPSIDPWIPKASMSQARKDFGYAYFNGKIYVAGGHNGRYEGQDIFLNSVEAYDPAANSWSSAGSLTEAVPGISLVNCNNTLYAIGSQSLYSDSNSEEIFINKFNPLNNTWSAVSQYGEGPNALTHRYASYCAYNNKIYMFGGTRTNVDGGETSRDIYEFDVSSGTWSYKAIGKKSYGSSAVLVNGEIYIIGGGVAGSDPCLNSVQIYNPLTNSRRYLVSQRYNPVTQKWEELNGMPEARAYMGAVGGDRVYIAGGGDYYDVFSTILEYNPGAGVWKTWPGSRIPRTKLGFVQTDDGLYIIGGEDSSHTVLDTMEFTPVGKLEEVNEYLHFGESLINPSGNFSRTFTDMEYNVPGFNIQITRTYNSLDTHIGPFGTGWTFGFEGRLTMSGNEICVRLPNGGGHMYKINTDGTYTAKDSRSTLIKGTGGTHVLTTADMYKYGFNSYGFLTWMQDRNGNRIDIQLDGSAGLVRSISDQGRRGTTSYNRTIEISYNAGRIEAIKGPDGKYVYYSYDSNNELNCVTSGKNKTYYVLSKNSAGQPASRVPLLRKIYMPGNRKVEEFTYYSGDSMPDGKVQSVKDVYGNVKSYAFDNHKGKVTITDSNGRTDETWFDQKLYPIRTRDAEGKETQTEYHVENGINRNGEVKSFTDRNGNTTFYDRDKNGNITRQVNPDGSAGEFSYDEHNNLLSEKDETGRMTYYIYDSEKKNLVKKVQPLNGTDEYNISSDDSDFAITSYTYVDKTWATGANKTIYGLLNTQTDPEGGVITYGYDDRGNVTSVKSPRNSLSSIVYYTNNEKGKVLTEKVGDYTTTYTYDDLGRRIKTVQHGGETEQIFYDDYSNPVQRITPAQYDEYRLYPITRQSYLGYRYEYNTNGLLIQEKDPLDNITAYEYDLYGNVIKKTHPNGGISLYEYDEMNRVSKEWFKDDSNAPEKLLKEYSYGILSDGKTTLTETVFIDSETGLSTVTTSDYAGRVVRVDNPDGTYITKTYNTTGTLARETDARGAVTTYEYNGMNLLSKKWSPADGGKHSYTEYIYDKAGRVIKESTCRELVNAGATPSGNFAWRETKYYKNGTVRERADSSGSKSLYSYDESGNVSSELVYTKEYNGNEISYVYNHLNKLTSKSLRVEKLDLIESGTGIINVSSSFTYDKMGNMLTETDAEGVTTTYTYDALGHQLSVSRPGLDENNNAITVTESSTYDTTGNVLTVTNPLGGVTTNTYDKRGNLTRVQDALGGITLYAYDLAGRKTAAVSPGHFSAVTPVESMTRTEYTYDNMSHVAEVKEIYKDESNTWKTIVSEMNEYDENGNLISKTDALGAKTVYTYTAGNRQKTVLDPENVARGRSFSVSYAYDGTGRMVRETNAEGADTTYTYNDRGNILSVAVDGITTQTSTYDLTGNVLTQTDGIGKVTTFTYNAFGKPRSLSLASGAGIGAYTVNYYYTRTGLLAKEMDSKSRVKLTTYNSLGQSIELRQKGIGVPEIVLYKRYDACGNLRYETDGNGVATLYAYDALGRKISDTRDGKTTEYTYDLNGNQTAITDWRQNVTSYEYDGLNRLIKTTDAYGKIVSCLKYNDKHLQVESKDALGNVTEFRYDRNGQLTKTINPLGKAKQKSYDGLGRVSTEMDERGNVTTYTYDRLGRLSGVQNAKNEQTTYTYDAMGNLLTQTDGEGNITEYEYNTRGLPIVKRDGLGQEERYSYEPEGLIRESTDRNGVKTTYTYDGHGRLLKKQKGGAFVSYTYDKNGNQLTVTDSETGAITRTYDAFNRTLTKAVQDMGTATYEYDIVTGLPSGHVAEKSTDPKGNATTKVFDKAGRLKSVSDGTDTVTYTYYDNGSRCTTAYSNGAVEEYTYYADNKLETLTNRNPLGDIIDAYKYWYDNAGNISEKLDGKGRTLYEYDELNRLESETKPDGTRVEYEYDAAGNRVSRVVDDTETVYAYDGNNRLTETQKSADETAVEITKYTYDPNGNMTFKAIETLEAIPESGAGAMTVSVGLVDDTEDAAVYEYDVWNRMTVARGSGSTLEMAYNGEGYRIRKTAGGGTVSYFYEGDKVVLETDGNGEQVGYNMYGLNLLKRAAGNEEYLYMYNGHGDVTALLTHGGNVAAAYYYDEWGNVTDETGSADNPYRYAGYRYDEENGLYYLNSRFYAPEIARFMQEDTYTGAQADPLSLNLYAYCMNNPLRYWDPTGHWAQGDEQYTYEIQQELMALTVAYNKAITQEEKDEIAAWANALRIDDNRKKGKNDNVRKDGSEVDKADVDQINNFVSSVLVKRNCNAGVQSN